MVHKKVTFSPMHAIAVLDCRLVNPNFKIVEAVYLLTITHIHIIVNILARK